MTEQRSFFDLIKHTRAYKVPRFDSHQYSGMVQIIMYLSSEMQGKWMKHAGGSILYKNTLSCSVSDKYFNPMTQKEEM